MFPFLTNIITWGKTFLLGFMPISGERIGKILWVAAICVATIFIWKQFTKPTSDTHQNVSKGGLIVNNYEQPKSTFGCSAVQVRHYYRDSEQVNSSK